jgi:hypothetical protein
VSNLVLPAAVVVLMLVARGRAQTVLKGETGRAGVEATLVSLDLKDASAEEALAALNKAAGTSLTFKTVPKERVTLKAEKRPLVEVLLQLRQQMKLGTPSNQTADAMVLGGSAVAEEVGMWCVSGPFGFIVNSVGHKVALLPGGTPGEETFGIGVQIMAEPDVQILGMPQGFAISEAADEKGHSLIDPKAVVKEGFSTSPNPVVYMQLKYPQDAGRKIAVVKAKARVLAMLKAERVTVKDPLKAAAMTKTVGGAKFALGPLTTGSRGHELSVTMEKGSLTDEQFQSLQTAMRRVAASVTVGGTQRQVRGNAGQVNGVGAQATLAYTFATTSPRGGSAVEITEMSIELPADVRAVDVPVEFHDLPLP